MDTHPNIVGTVMGDSKIGKIVTILGIGALKNSVFAARKDIDLTKPIAPHSMNSIQTPCRKQLVAVA